MRHDGRTDAVHAWRMDKLQRCVEHILIRLVAKHGPRGAGADGAGGGNRGGVAGDAETVTPRTATSWGVYLERVCPELQGAADVTTV